MTPSDAPTIIYLQWNPENYPDVKFSDSHDVSWCRDRINKTDLEYVPVSDRDRLAERLATAEAENAAVAVDARRYRRLRVLGCAVHNTKELSSGTVVRFTGLDEIIDGDMKVYPSRGESEVVTGTALTQRLAWLEEKNKGLMKLCLLLSEAVEAHAPMHIYGEAIAEVKAKAKQALEGK